MNRVFSIPDLSHLEQLRKRLWEGKEYGRAAVMVGAGFSRNAEPKAENAHCYPLWNELAGHLYEDLYPPGTVPGDEYQRDKLRMTSGSGVLKLAQEYETWFGREQLNRALLETIPYRAYRPGGLHGLLLSLPWSDVFTTNYDTLLEETLPSIYHRKYDVCLVMDDIPLKMRPRLTKLHGSFPSHTPFIITEEDYRTYPSKFAPLVNMVQQSLMENALCLIGFSGDDPNFLRWTGWVRDNLKEHTPSIYLCGILNLSLSQRKLLQDRRIIPIDLSHLPLDKDMDSALRHKKALEWLLLSLFNGKPEDRRNWPLPSASTIETPSDSLPPILPVLSTISNPWEVARPQEPPDAKMLRGLLEAWKGQREQYPGWVVCPKQNRAILWLCTQYWLSPIAESLSLFKPWEGLFLLRELNWRLERCLVPLGELENQVKQVVILFNPFADHLDLPDTEYHSDDSEWCHLDWEEIRVSWVELVFALARRARERFDQSTFLQWMGFLKKLVPLKKNWLARHWYEDCLYSLFWLDVETLRRKLDDCPLGMDYPFHQTKRASLMAEVGLLQDAGRFVQESLDVIRRCINPQIDDYLSLSQEGWTMMINHLLERDEAGLPQGIRPLQRDRWEKLSTFKCNSSEDLNQTATAVSEGRPTSSPPWEERVGFDPGHRIEIRRYEHDSEFEKCWPAFQFLRLFEDGGQPVKLGNSDIWGSCTANAAKWIASLEPEMAISYMIRDSHHQEIKTWFNRVRVAIMDQKLVDRLYSRLYDSLKQVINFLNSRPDDFSVFGGNVESRLVRILPEILSRLCFRLSDTDRAQLFDLMIEMYELPLFTRNFHLHEGVQCLFERTLLAMNDEEILGRMPRLISLPIPEVKNFPVIMTEFLPEPFRCVRWESFRKINPGLDLSLWQEPIRNLLRILEEGGVESRTRALLRLGRLDKIGALDVDQQRNFVSALWSVVDPLTKLPANTSLQICRFLLLPEPESGKAKELFRNHVLTLEFPQVLTKQSFVKVLANPQMAKTSPKRNRAINEILNGTLRIDIHDHEYSSRLVDWSMEEAIQILRRSAAWWDENRSDLNDPEITTLFSTGDDLRAELSKLVPLFADVILPRLSAAQESDKNMALRVLREMEEEGFCIFSCAPATLFIDHDHVRHDDVARHLRLGLNASGADEVVGCIQGFSLWFLYAHKGALPDPPKDLLQELVTMVSSRRRPGLELAMQKLSFIIRRMTDQVSQEMVSSLCVGLEYLKKETELPADLDKELTSSSHPTIPIERRPDCRKDSAYLAQALYSHVSSLGGEIPRILTEWQDICRSDPLPEVRDAWS